MEVSTKTTPGMGTIVVVEGTKRNSAYCQTMEWAKALMTSPFLRTGTPRWKMEDAVLLVRFLAWTGANIPLEQRGRLRGNLQLGS